MHNETSSKAKQINFEVIIMTFIIAIFGYITYLLILSLVNNYSDYNSQIFIFNWVGIFLLIYIIVTWHKLTNTFLSPYIIFMLFFFLFNFGQCFMWALGIHIPSEVGQAVMYRDFGIANDADIFKNQALTLVCILMFHLGALSSYKSKYKISCIRKNSYRLLSKNEDHRSLKAIYYVCLLIGMVVIPIALYNSYSDFQVAKIYGYSALYYSEFARKSATIPALLSMMFFPCLIGLLIGSKYNKRIQRIVYIIFMIYLIINLLSGDRGSWIYRIFILIWLNNACYKPINFKSAVKYIIIGFTGLYITYIIVSFRNIGLSNISIERIFHSFSFENSPVVTAVFEMGGSMKPTIILQKYGWNIWPYVNTYLLAILGMITNKFIYALDVPFELLSSWFSEKYLGISWGAGFSIIAEALINFGPILAPLFMILLGFIIASMIYIDKGINYKERPLRFFFAAATLDDFINITRNDLHPTLKNWFYGVVLLYFFILFVRKFVLQKNHMRNNT